MNIEVVYVCPLYSGPQYTAQAWRFINSYLLNPPGIEHNTTLVCNGCPATDDVMQLFKTMLPNCKLFEHDNSGFDIGAFQHVARSVPADMMVFFGSTAYVKGAGWLVRMAQAFLTKPECQFGSMGNRGNMAYNVYPHIRTTGFWMRPDTLNKYPTIVTNPGQRYPFEHGKDCLTEFLRKRAVKSYVATWHGIYESVYWNDDPNGFHRGDQSSMLSGDRLTEAPFFNGY